MADAQQVRDEVGTSVTDRDHADQADHKEEHKEEQKWLSSKLDASVMAALDEKAKATGLSRSEAVRQAIVQWVGRVADNAPGRGEDPEISEIPGRLERIEASLGELTATLAAASIEIHEAGESSPAGSEDSHESLAGMQMHSGDDLLNWIDGQARQPSGQQDPQDSENSQQDPE